MAIYSNYDEYGGYGGYDSLNYNPRCCTGCGRSTVYGNVYGFEWLCKYCAERRSLTTPTIDAQLDSAERRVMELLAKKDAIAKFDNDYANDDAILFKRQFKTAGPIYTYVAVRTPVGWYITGKDAHRGMSFQTLVEEHLLYASEVWVCAEWRQIC
jgi:hypothetical protein